jgi:catechol 2,3-dioxygenase-like lactoylglutathione lyase family enzyme
LPTFLGFEQISMTVPDLDEAARVFVEVLGARLVADAELGNARTRVLGLDHIDVRLVERLANSELDQVWPGMLDIGGWHLAFYVDDVDAALEHLAALDLRVLGGKKPAYLYEAGDEAYTVHCLTSFGFYFELVTYPTGRYRAAEHAVPAWHPAS